MDLGLQDSVVFIGGSSRGIGYAIARAFLEEHARVILTGRNASALADAAEQLGAISSNDRVATVVGDLTNPASVQKMWNDALGVFGTIDIVVGNVGSGTAKGGWQLQGTDWDEVLRCNLVGSMLLTTAALDYMSAKGAGNVVLTSSIAGLEAINAPVSYSAAKAALGSAVKSLSRLAGPNGVRVNAVAPGNILFPGGSWEKKLTERRDFFENYVRTEVPMQRFGKPEEIADAVVFLASNRASFITGACLVVDGGQTRAFF